ncbi:hypothetical protein N8T08_005080 [Aspergillus melleus]|uniref:Uncharacterized protein n=1 Tax=Aspergillus melleus TaxID=138277 RepID=A0ACC3BGC3_9EURO|nr:hypothetical protein N8T08_005080 [Aspergillus melleus]
MSMPEAELAGLAELLAQDPGLPRKDPTQSYWQQTPHALAAVQSASLPAKIDVAVIGSGITGASVAKALLEQHSSCKVTVFEARTLCSGATGRNGGQLAINAAESYVQLKEAVGPDMAGKIVRFNLENLDRLREVASEMPVDDVELTDLRKLRSFKGKESFEVVKQGVAAVEVDHPSLRGIYEILSLERFTDVNFDSTADAKYPYALHTPRGIVRVTQVAYCTNAYTGYLLQTLRDPLFPLKGTMTVQDLGPNYENKGSSDSWAIHYKPYLDPEDGTYADGLIYGMQNVNTGAFFFGGEKESATDMVSADDNVLSPSSVRFLQESLLSLFGRDPKDISASRIVSTWSGAMCFSSDEMPLVGRLPSSVTNNAGQGEWICAAYSGYGMPTAWLAGESLAALILGFPPPDCLPDAYLITEARLKERLSTEKSVERLLGN